MSAILRDRFGQLKIQQMAFMLIAVTLFFVLVVLFYLAIKTSNLEQSKIDLEREKAAGLVTKIAAMPELTYEGVSRAIDADKVMMLRAMDEYEGFFGVKGIIIRKLYPVEENKDCKLGTYPDCNIIKLFTNRNVAPVSSYVALCRKKTIEQTTYDHCELAIIMLEVD